MSVLLSKGASMTENTDLRWSKFHRQYPKLSYADFVHLLDDAQNKKQPIETDAVGTKGCKVTISHLVSIPPK
jgi:hypothetical protein